MIVDPGAASGENTTLDDCFRRAGVRDPDRIALSDPPNRPSAVGGAPRTLTYAQADRAISALAARLRSLGLATDTIVAIQSPNTVESAIALLGVLRAGMVAALLPLLWRRQDTVAALGKVGAKVILTHARMAEHAMQAAAELFPVRFICGFGAGLPDGIAPLDDCFAPDAAPPPLLPRPDAAAQRTACITYDAAAGGMQPVLHSHAALIGSGRKIFVEANIAADVLSAIVPGSSAWVTLSIVPWLLVGGTLALHHPFDAETFAAQSLALNKCTAVLPGPVLTAMNEAALLGPHVENVVAYWRAPERFAQTPAWEGRAALTNVVCADETDTIVTRRGGDNYPAPAGLTGVGGYRFKTSSLEADVAAIDPNAVIVALPDTFLDERLAGTAAEPERVRTGLERRGVNPLVSGAFRKRQPGNAA